MTLPLGLRNRLAELVLDAFDEPETCRTLRALGAWCRSPERPVPPEADARLASLGWFQRDGAGRLRLPGAHRAHGAALGARVERALLLFAGAAALPEATTLAGVLARAALLADEGLFFEVHELLEPAWMRAEGSERVALQGLIQVAVGLHHAEGGNREGALSLLAEGLSKLATTEPALPLDTRSWQPGIRAMLAALRDGRVPPPPPPWPTPAICSTPTPARDTAWRSS